VRNRYDETPIKQFRRLSIAWLEASKRSNNKLANKINKELIELTRVIMEQEGASELIALLADADEAVRYSAACVVLKSAPERALPVLEAIEHGPRGVLAASAFSTLWLWRQGHSKQ